MINKLRPIAINLPQFHPIPENDKWWGKGFTEWTNVTKAKPLFKGHYQPHLPADLGFYDLRLEEARVAQAELAKAYGIYGFCYYHYWFNGKRLLERPVQDILNSGKPDYPFMLCWANENWSRKWDGGNKNILIEQKYSIEDDRNHIKFLIPIFKDKRYIRINNRPVFCIYRSAILPNTEQTIQMWREEAYKQGLELYLCNFETFGNMGSIDDGFDSAVEFQPFSETLWSYLKLFKNLESKQNFLLRQKINFLNKIRFGKRAQQMKHAFLYRHSYPDYVEYLIKTYKYPTYKRFPGIMPSWDTTPRHKERCSLFYDSTPKDYEKWLNFQKNNFIPPSEEENFIFINAWNEWAEGNHLEPCQKWGLQYLEATKEIFVEN